MLPSYTTYPLSTSLFFYWFLTFSHWLCMLFLRTQQFINKSMLGGPLDIYSLKINLSFSSYSMFHHWLSLFLNKLNCVNSLVLPHLRHPPSVSIFFLSCFLIDLACLFKIVSLVLHIPPLHFHIILFIYCSFCIDYMHALFKDTANYQQVNALGPLV